MTRDPKVLFRELPSVLPFTVFLFLVSDVQLTTSVLPL